MFSSIFSDSRADHGIVCGILRFAFSVGLFFLFWFYSKAILSKGIQRDNMYIYIYLFRILKGTVSQVTLSCWELLGRSRGVWFFQNALYMGQKEKPNGDHRWLGNIFP